MKKISLLMMALIVTATMSANKFTKVTSAPADWSGVYLMAYTSDSCAYVFNGKDASNGYVKATPVSGVITSNDLDGYLVEIAKMEGGYSVKWFATGKYMAGESGSNKLNFLADPAANTINFYTADSIDFISNTSYLTFNATSDQMRFRYYKESTAITGKSKNMYKHLSLYKADSKPETWTPDTISVSRAVEIIRDSLRTPKGELLMEKSHYIKGVVATAPTDPGSYGNTTFWMTDIDTPADSIYAFKIYGEKGAKIATIDDIPFGLCDTIMIKADAMILYVEASTGRRKYEATPGEYVETIGKSAVKDAAATFPHAYGAVYMDTIAGVHRYEIVLSKEKDAYENALHYVIRTANAKGIAGTHSTYPDSSYVDGEGQVSGSITITYVAEGTPNNTYSLKGNFTVGGLLYRFNDANYDLAGYPDPEGEPYKLVDDVPFVPQDGDTITCAQAASYAKTLGSTTSELTVWVRGFATGFQTISGRTQQSVYMADNASAKEGIFMGYLCYTQNLDSIVKGDEVLVKGNISYYASKSLAQISKGNIYRIGGSDTKRARDIECVEVPESAISVAEALEIGNALECSAGQTVTTEEEYIVLGYIVDVNRQTSRDSATWYMADEKGVYGDFEAYKCQIPNLIDEDDYVYVQGKISKFVSEDGTKTTIEISKGAGDFVCDPSGIEEVAAKEAFNSKKVLINGQLYIVQDGVLYNAQGVIIR